MKKLCIVPFLTGLFLSCTIAQGMEKGENNEENEVTQSVSPTSTTDYIVKTCSKFLETSLNKLLKNTDPIEYATGKETKLIYAIAEREFHATHDESQYKQLKNYNPRNDEPKRAKGDLLKKINDRIASFSIGREFLVSKIVNEKNELAKEGNKAQLRMYMSNKELIDRVSLSRENMYFRAFLKDKSLLQEKENNNDGKGKEEKTEENQTF